MTRPVATPLGAWPLEMRAETAAGFCDERSTDAFLRKVVSGEYPQPVRKRGCLPKWHRAQLEYAIARRHGLHMELGPPAEDVAELI